MKYPFTGVILAGGQASRFSGTEKGLLRAGGLRLLDRIYAVMDEFFEEIILVTNSPLQYLDWDLHLVTDIYPIRSSLTGIHAGLFYASNRSAFVTACDTPFLKKDLVRLLLDAMRPDLDAVMPETAKGVEPLCAVYSRKCLETVERHLSEGKLKIQLALRKTRIRKLSEKSIRKIDPDLLSFFNINTPSDLTAAEALFGSGLSES